MKGGKVTKIGGKWIIEDTGETNARVKKYRDLELIVLNELALESISTNSNEALKETIIEDTYHLKCETCKTNHELYDDLKSLKEDIASIINLRNEESIDKMKPSETPEEETIRKSHEYRIKLWREKYKVIKKLFQDLRRTIHKPIERETFFLTSEKTTIDKKKRYLTEKIIEMDSNLKDIDGIFAEIIQKSTSFKSELERINDRFEPLPDVFQSTATFTYSLQQFIEQKQIELINSKKIFQIRKEKLKEMLEEILQTEVELLKEEEEDEQIEAEDKSQEEEDEQIEAEDKSQEARDRQEKISKTKEMKKLAQEEKEIQRQKEEDKQKLIKKSKDATQEIIDSIESDRAFLNMFHDTKTFYVGIEKKISKIVDKLNDTRDFFNPETINKIYELHAKMKKNPDDKKLITERDKLNEELERLKEKLNEVQKTQIDELNDILIPELVRLRKMYFIQKEKMDKIQPQFDAIIEKMERAKQLKAAAAKGGTKRKRKMNRTRKFR